MSSVGTITIFTMPGMCRSEGQIFPEFVRLLEQFGRHRLYQVDTTGYFDLVGSDLTFAGENPDLYLAASTWLGSRMPVAKKHPLVSFGDPFQGEAPLTSAIDLIPEMDPPTTRHGGVRR